MLSRRVSAALRFVPVLLCLALALGSCSSSDVSPAPAAVVHEPATLKLIALAESNTEFKALLVESIALAKAENPDTKTNPAQTLEEFYAFIDWASHCMPWNILRNQTYPLIYEQIDQSLDFFYFAIDRPLPELKGRGLYRNSLQYYEPFRSWMIAFIKSWGAYLDTPASWKNEYYLQAVADNRFGFDKGWYEDPSKWTTFNQFFARQLKDPGQRPIASPTDDSVVASPADAVPQGVWSIDADSNLVNPDGANVKSSTLYSIKDLLGSDSAYRDAFANGVLTHTFLDVNDYHRYHFPVAGTVKEMRTIAQDDAVGGIISWSPAKKKYLLDAAVGGWQFIETRGYVIIDTGSHGLVAVMPVGMSQVSSVNFEPNVTVGATFAKGAMLGYFLFGGSDVVMLFQPQAGFQITAPAGSGGGYAHQLMGEAYGTLGNKR